MNQIAVNLAKLFDFFGSNDRKISRKKLIFWLVLSLTFSLFYSFLAVRQAFSSEYVVQDDARQHVFWMMRFSDPELFSNDLIADYFQSVAPIGYQTIYRGAIALGINPLIFNKILPIFISLITTTYCFALALEFIPIPGTAFLCSLVFNQNVWMRDDIASATPRAFTYVILLAFLYYLSRRSLLPCLATILVAGLFYPHSVFLCSGLLIIQLIKWKKKGFYFLQNSQDYRFCFMGLGMALLVMLPYALTKSEFAPIISVEQAKQLPEFLPGGRSEFFYKSFFQYFFTGRRSGMFSTYPLVPLTLITGLFLPIFIKFPILFPLAKRIKSKIWLIPQLILVSLIMFCIAHAFLFKLHLPNRYTAYSFSIAITLATGISLTLILDALAKWTLKSTFIKSIIALFFTILLYFVILFYPSFLDNFPTKVYLTGQTPELYDFFQKQPKDILIASLAEDTNSNLPSFTQRSILTAREYSIPYHWGYYSQIRQKIIDLIQAHYSSNPEEVKQFINTYNIDLFLLDQDAFDLDYLSDRWLQQFQPYTQEAQAKLEGDTIPVLKKAMEICSIFKTEDFVVIEAKCIDGLKF
ncbi:MAG: hypothetical protein MUD14_03110 [Hydrococcus sp. Prado102]|nr:hypothetical protein [Hydrococcus sp. Prado102]